MREHTVIIILALLLVYIILTDISWREFFGSGPEIMAPEIAGEFDTNNKHLEPLYRDVKQYTTNA